MHKLFLLIMLFLLFTALWHCGIIGPEKGESALDTLLLASDTLKRGDSTWIAVRAASVGPDSQPEYGEIHLRVNWGCFKDTANHRETKSLILEPDTQGRAGAWLYYPLDEEPGLVIVTATAGDDTLSDTLYFAGELARPPLTILLDTISSRELQVAGYGGLEIATLNFLVLDKEGAPVVDGLEVVFGKTGPVTDDSLLAGKDTTDHGRVATKLKSGTQAGVAGIQASLTFGSLTVVSDHVLFVIHGGPPVDSNFTVTASPLNLPGLAAPGCSTRITVLAFDRYNNPVRPQTPIYFTATAGGVQAAGFTDGNGRASVDFYASELQPLAPAYLATVTAKSLNGQDTVQGSCQVLLTDSSLLSVTPADSFTLANGGSREFTIQAGDLHGHPLAAGSQITVTSSIGALRGNTSVVMDDRLIGGTEYKVVLVDADSSARGECMFRVELTSPNGNRYVEIWGGIE